MLMIVAVIVLPLFCLALAIGGVFVGFIATSATAADANTGPNMSQDEVEAQVLDIAAEYAGTQDLALATQRLEAMNLPNSAQYVSFMVDRYIQENRGIDDVDTQNLFMLAQALGSSTTSMAMVLATPTPLPTPTLPPTATNTPEPSTATPEPTEEIIPTDTPEPEPTAIPIETEVPATDTPVPLPTNTPGPPTNTPEPTATPEPTKPAVDFVVEEAYLMRNPEYNSCPGWHQIFVTVVDVNGNPIDNVTVRDTFSAVPPHVTGEKGPGKVEYDLWNNGFSLQITNKADGSPATSEATPKMSSWDEDIPDDWLVAANYCKDLGDCAARKANNQLCRGHYAYQATFKRTY